MKIGTKSVLFGVHQFALHPLLIAAGWWKAYGFRRVVIQEADYRYCGLYAAGECADVCSGCGLMPSVATSLCDPRLWIAFLVHDLGYIGKPNMDGAEGETHPEFGARVMRGLFGEPWGDFVLLHSRYYAKRLGRELSPLCLADKWVIVLEPSWLYLPRVRLSGELEEFLDVAERRAASPTAPTDPLTDEERIAFLARDAKIWHRTLKAYMRRWIEAHQDGGPDTWTRVRHGAEVRS